MDIDMLTISNNAGNLKLSYKQFNDITYFKAKDIATILGYSNTRQAIIDHVDDAYKHNLKDIAIGNETRLLAGSDHNMIYLTEQGL